MLVSPRLPRVVFYGGLASTLVAFTVLLGAVRPWTDERVEGLTNCDVADASVDAEESAFLAIINEYRANNGGPPLRISPSLTRAAHWMAADMPANNYFGHTDSLGRSPWTRIVDCGYPVAGGENLAAGTNRSTARSAFELFQGSPSHNENMLLDRYTEIGIARVYREGSKYGWYWATNFGTQAAAPPPPPPPPPAAAAAAAAPAARPRTNVVVAAAAPEPPPPPPVALLAAGEGERIVGAAIARLRGDDGRQGLASVLTRSLTRMIAARQLAEVRQDKLRLALERLPARPAQVAPAIP